MRDYFQTPRRKLSSHTGAIRTLRFRLCSDTKLMLSNGMMKTAKMTPRNPRNGLKQQGVWILPLLRGPVNASHLINNNLITAS